MKRAVRFGQKRNVTVHRFVTRETVEEELLRRIEGEAM